MILQAGGGVDDGWHGGHGTEERATPETFETAITTLLLDKWTETARLRIVRCLRVVVIRLVVGSVRPNPRVLPGKESGMLRLLVGLLVGVVSAGCRSQPNCYPFSSQGMRVPPPATGSVGPPNTYYPNVGPRTSAVPASPGRVTSPPTSPAAPRATSASSGGWRSVAEDRSTTPALATESNAPVGTDAVATSPLNTNSASMSVIAPTAATVSSTLPRLNAMHVNEVKPAVVAPASFATPATAADDSLESTVRTSSSKGTENQTEDQPESTPPARAATIQAASVPSKPTPASPPRTNNLRATSASLPTEASPRGSELAPNRLAAG